MKYLAYWCIRMYDAIVEMIDQRTKVMTINRDKILADEMNLRTVAYMIGDMILPMCCMLCNVNKLQEILEKTVLCKDNIELAHKLAKLVYDYLARCNGLG